MILKVVEATLSALREESLRAGLRPQDAAAALDAHRRILAAVRRRDPEAAAADMLPHIENTARVLATGSGRPAAPALM